MLKKTKATAPLQPYFKNFFYLYATFIITAALVMYGLSYLGGSFNQLTNTAIGASALIMTTILISQKFAQTHQRFFNAQELHHMILGTTALSCVLQIILLAIYLAMLKFLTSQMPNGATAVLKDLPVNHMVDMLKIPFTSWCITFAATFTITFILQSLNFRFIARTVIQKKMR